QPAATRSGTERVLIHLTADPSTAMLIRRGERVADYLQAECLGVYIQKNEHSADLSKEEQDAIDKLLSFAANLHIEVTTLTCKDTGKALGDFAREHRVTQIFVSRNSRDIERIVDLARDMEVTIIAERRR
ncbi:MAG: histidine kinase, partial [Acidobacteriota bacterium]|nr:histidine kinase [Acidobacteriota bacterium]